jgi:hypothetical protein
MDKKIIDLLTFRIEKALKESGYAVKKDKNRNIKLLIKIKK